MLVILNKGQTTIWEEIEIYSPGKVYTIERLLVDKNIGLVNACNIKERTNHELRGNRDIFSGKSIYNRETISRQEHRISERL